MSYLVCAWHRILQERLFAKGILYQVNVLDGRIDNTDQRIAESVDTFVQLFIGNVLGSFNMPFSILLQIITLLTSIVYVWQYGYVPALVTLGCTIILGGSVFPNHVYGGAWVWTLCFSTLSG